MLQLEIILCIIFWPASTVVGHFPPSFPHNCSSWWLQVLVSLGIFLLFNATTCNILGTITLLQINSAALFCFWHTRVVRKGPERNSLASENRKAKKWKRKHLTICVVRTCILMQKKRHMFSALLQQRKNLLSDKLYNICPNKNKSNNKSVSTQQLYVFAGCWETALRLGKSFSVTECQCYGKHLIQG